jgi:hypothetical protein
VYQHVAGQGNTRKLRFKKVDRKIYDTLEIKNRTLPIKGHTRLNEKNLPLMIAKTNQNPYSKTNLT